VVSKNKAKNNIEIKIIFPRSIVNRTGVLKIINKKIMIFLLLIFFHSPKLMTKNRTINSRQIKNKESVKLASRIAFGESKNRLSMKYEKICRR
jgi:hypothetical protein